MPPKVQGDGVEPGAGPGRSPKVGEGPPQLQDNLLPQVLAVVASGRVQPTHFIEDTGVSVQQGEKLVFYGEQRVLLAGLVEQTGKKLQRVVVYFDERPGSPLRRSP